MTRDFSASLGKKRDELVAQAVERFELRMLEHSIPSICESEIEAMLGIAFFANEKLDDGHPFGNIRTHGWQDKSSITIESMVERCRDQNVLHVYPQVIVGKSRVDFMCYSEISLPGALHPNFIPIRKFLAVECDGHDFHERTKEQAARDRSRDRDLLSAGIPSMRFTGAEIWKDAYLCVSQIDAFFYNAIIDVCQLTWTKGNADDH